ncbi:MAG: DUF4163 domain-containing protein [Bacteroidetes bacterium]|nr:DUF4163 domain-containing protein [Bacteroidota bacterium]
MKKQLLACLAFCGFASLFSCKNGTKAPEATNVVVSTIHFNKSDGADCDKPDTLRMDCATINLSYPNVEEGSGPLKKNVAAWAEKYLTGILEGYDSLGNPISSNSLDAAAASFFQTRKDFAKEAPDAPGWGWTAESEDTVLLNNGNHLTLEIVGYTFQGGAHGSPTASVATFEASTGKQLTWNDLVTDTTALKAVAEKKFREERADIFKPTDGSEPFKFDDIFQFKLPDNYGLTQAGIYCRYLAYEVGPYAIGETVLTISFEELGTLSKIKQ